MSPVVFGAAFEWQNLMPAQLVALNDGPSILLDKPILLLGRHPECDIQIDSRKVSRRHCCIAQVSDYLVVRDLASTNGIRINGVRVVEGRLAEGDELTLGNHRYKVTWDVVPSTPNPLRPPKKQTVRVPSPPADPEDELLESCDEPVPLKEPGADRPLEDQPVLHGESSSNQSHATAEEPVILPEELELLPNSGIYPKIAPHESGSHPPA
jgi:pSer/pThr/pTyr-binding forkhead associated (FHA) protein